MAYWLYTMRTQSEAQKQKEAWALLVRRMRETERPIAAQPGGEPRGIAFDPGDYSKLNEDLIGRAELYRSVERLWRAEASSSVNGARSFEARQLADRWQDIRLLTQRFYSRWNIEP